MKTQMIENKEILIYPRDEKDLLVPIDIAKIEKSKNAIFVCETCIKDRYGNWALSPVQIYWQEKPPVEGYSNYFAIFIRDGSVYITSGHSAAEEEFYGIFSDGEIDWSRDRWDYRKVGSGRACVDGGRDYLKVVGSPDEYVVLKIEGPHVVVKKRINPSDWFNTDGQNY